MLKTLYYIICLQNRILVLENCVKSVCIRSFTGPYFPTLGLNTEKYGVPPYSVRIRENTDQKNSKYGHFSRTWNYRDDWEPFQISMIELFCENMWQIKAVNYFCLQSFIKDANAPLRHILPCNPALIVTWFL